MSVFFLSITALCAVSAANLNPINVLLDVSFSSGEAYVNITLGNNEIAVILDSGSSTLAVPIQYSECKGVCFDTCQGPFDANCIFGTFDSSVSQHFDPLEASSTVCGTDALNDGSRYSDYCSFSISYLDESGVHGIWAQDELAIGPLKGRVFFGIYNDAIGQFADPPAGGIMGVAKRSGNELAGADGKGDMDLPVAFAELLAQNGYNDVFALCFPQDEGLAGIMTIGGIDERYTTGDMLLTPDVSSTFDYQIYVKTVSVGLETIDDSVLMVIDSGTTLAFIPPSVHDKLLGIFNSEGNCNFESGATDGYCQRNIATTNMDMTLSLSRGTLHLKGSDYIDCITAAQGYQCYIALQPSSDQSYLIGQVLMRNYYTVFNRTAKTISFATANCAPCASMETEAMCVDLPNCFWSKSASACGVRRSGSSEARVVYGSGCALLSQRPCEQKSDCDWTGLRCIDQVDKKDKATTTVIITLAVISAVAVIAGLVYYLGFNGGKRFVRGGSARGPDNYAPMAATDDDTMSTMLLAPAERATTPEATEAAEAHDEQPTEEEV